MLLLRTLIGGGKGKRLMSRMVAVVLQLPLVTRLLAMEIFLPLLITL